MKLKLLTDSNITTVIRFWSLGKGIMRDPSAQSGTFEPSLYPRTYPASGLSRFKWISVAALVGAGGLCAAWYWDSNGTLRDSIARVSVALLSGLAAVYIILLMVRSRIVLGPDAITVRTIISTKKMLRNEIAGWRLLPTQYISMLELTPCHKALKKLRIGMFMRTDTLFHAWFSGIPDLEAQDLARSELQITADSNIAPTPALVLGRLLRARKVAKASTVIAIAASLWGWFFPRPYEFVVAVLIFLPIGAVLLAAQSKELYGFGELRNDARADLGATFLVPGIVLTFRALMDIQLLAWMPALVWVLLGVLFVTVVVFYVDKRIRKRKWQAALLLLFATAYSYGTIAQLNVLLDRSTPERFEATVLNKHVSSDRNPTWELEISPWGSRHGNADVSAPRFVYDSVAPGQSVCIYIRAGALKIPWYYVRLCR